LWLVLKLAECAWHHCLLLLLLLLLLRKCGGVVDALSTSSSDIH
jgi:hypothetical protein